MTLKDGLPAADSKNQRKPHFFKILTGDFHRCLRIPPNFMKHISDVSSCQALLYNTGKKAWHVDFRRTTEGVFFSSGWSRFVDDCALREHDFLVFRYDGDMHFTVMLFDKTGNQKANSAATELGTVSGLGRKAVKRRLSIDHAEVDDLILAKTENGDHSRHIAVEDVSKGHEENGLASAASTVKPKGTNTNTWHRLVDIKKSVESFSSEFPHFVLRMSKSSITNSHTVRLPVTFTREHLPSMKTNFVLYLTGAEEQKWNVVYLAGHAGMLSGGWTAFARDNKIKLGDYCAFELVGPLEFKVTIFKL